MTVLPGLLRLLHDHRSLHRRARWPQGSSITTFIKNTPGAVSAPASRCVRVKELTPFPSVAVRETLARCDVAREVLGCRKSRSLGDMHYETAGGIADLVFRIFSQ